MSRLNLNNHASFGKCTGWLTFLIFIKLSVLVMPIPVQASHISVGLIRATAAAPEGKDLLKGYISGVFDTLEGRVLCANGLTADELEIIMREHLIITKLPPEESAVVLIIEALHARYPCQSK